jgi:hydroxymethylglutaryl-CoA reductase
MPVSVPRVPAWSSFDVKDSRVTGLYKLDLAERIAELQRRGWLSPEDADALRNGRHVLPAVDADRMVENVIGTFALPFAVAPNFRVNDRDYVVPMVVEEPSVVAALSHAASLARENGGFTVSSEQPLLAGQVHVSDMADGAVEALQGAADELLAMANAVHPRLVSRGGGARSIDVRKLELPDGAPLLAVHVLVDTCDAMGANLVNTICEALAPRIEELTGGKVELRILSNLCDSALVTARVSYATSSLGKGQYGGEFVRDAIVRANDIALRDPWRAATHNKGIMNGVDPIAIATGNDWRAVEAGAHAYAAQAGHYRALTRWAVDDNGDLEGVLRIPLKVGTVGGTLDSNPAAKLALAITGVGSATELACLMAAAGLAQNFAALRALVTSGIQQGHMRLHARSVAATVGVPEHLFDELVDGMVASGEIKSWKAQQLLAEMTRREPDAGDGSGTAAGKVILLGEHAVVYGAHALALPVPDAVSARIARIAAGIRLHVPDWHLARDVTTTGGDGVDALVMRIFDELAGGDDGFSIHVRSRLPRGMGLGSSAAVAVALVRALASALRLEIDDERVNALAFECEKIAHGTPSGVDNTLATFAAPMLFRNDGGLHAESLSLEQAPPIVVAWGTTAGDTREQVARVRERRDAEPAAFDAIFARMDEFALQGADALRDGDYERLGRLMNIGHGLLNAIGVSTPELERMVAVARCNGAMGAKLTGAGGGGSIVALCPGRTREVAAALRAAGFRTLDEEID